MATGSGVKRGRESTSDGSADDDAPKSKKSRTKSIAAKDLEELDQIIGVVKRGNQSIAEVSKDKTNLEMVRAEGQKAKADALLLKNKRLLIEAQAMADMQAFQREMTKNMKAKSRSFDPYQ